MKETILFDEFKSFSSLLNHLANFGKIDALQKTDGTRPISFEELHTRCYSRASALRKMIKKGERVALIDLTGPEWVISFFAVVLNGAIVVPIDSRMSTEAKDRAIAMVSPALIISAKDQETSIPVILCDSFEISQDHWVPIEIPPDTPAEIIFTSGTWGFPKGVILTHRNLLSNAFGTYSSYHPSPGSTTLSILPLSHAYEQTVGTLVPLISGCKIVYQESLDSFSLIDSLQKHSITHIVAVPRFLELLHAAIKRKAGKDSRKIKLICHATILPKNLRKILATGVRKALGSALHTFIIASAPLSRDTEQFFKAIGYEIIVGYGLTEASPTLTVHTNQTRSQDCVGKPIRGVTLRIEPDYEVSAKGPNISPGYWQCPPRDSEWLPTGDLGRIDTQGNLHIIGRKKHLAIFPTGDKILLEDIEQITQQAEGVIECCALNAGTTQSPSLAVTFIGTISPESLSDQINQNLPRFAHISKVLPFPEKKLPRTHTLKLKRDTVQDVLVANRLL